MNKKELTLIRDGLDEKKSQLEGVRDATQDEFDELSEKAQEGAKGEKLNEQIEALNEACDLLDSVVSSISGLLED